MLLVGGVVPEHLGVVDDGQLCLERVAFDVGVADEDVVAAVLEDAVPGHGGRRAALGEDGRAVGFEEFGGEVAPLGVVDAQSGADA